MRDDADNRRTTSSALVEERRLAGEWFVTLYHFATPSDEWPAGRWRVVVFHDKDARHPDFRLDYAANFACEADARSAFAERIVAVARRIAINALGLT